MKLYVIFEVLLEFVFGGLGLVLLPALTFGRARFVNADDKITFRWWGVAKQPNGKILVDPDYAPVLGLTVVLLVAILVVVY